MIPGKLTSGMLFTLCLMCLAGCQGVSSNQPNNVNAAGQLSLTPTSVSFGNVAVGSTDKISANLTATGADVTVTAANTNDDVFSISGPSLPLKISAGQTATFSVTFSPQASGAATGTLSFTSNAQKSIMTAALNGTGTQPSHTVTLSWDASTSPEIAGYNIYRAVSSGSCSSYSRINASLEASTQYTDTSVVSGMSYCYATTAVNASNQESDYSNIAVVTP